MCVYGTKLVSLVAGEGVKGVGRFICTSNSAVILFREKSIGMAEMIGSVNNLAQADTIKLILFWSYEETWNISG